MPPMREFVALALVVVVAVVAVMTQGAAATTSTPSKSPSRSPSRSPTAFDNYVMDETVAIVAPVLGGLIFGTLIVWYPFKTA
jgi:hypothetical protein